jgi:hypothetical protein
MASWTFLITGTGTHRVPDHECQISKGLKDDWIYRVLQIIVWSTPRRNEGVVFRVLLWHNCMLAEILDVRAEGDSHEAVRFYLSSICCQGSG